jgi:hypothetical protein
MDKIVSCCKNCPFSIVFVQGTDIATSRCFHPYQREELGIVYDPSTLPYWCPLTDESITIKLKDEHNSKATFTHSDHGIT